MKKITLFAALLAATSFVGAQNTTSFGTVPLTTTETFESWPSTFSKPGNSLWAQPIHSFYTNSATKTQKGDIDATAATVNDGTAATGQTLKLTVPETVLLAGAKKAYLRIATNIVAPADTVSAPLTGETYMAVFNAKSDAPTGNAALLDKQDKNTPITSTWSKQVVQCTTSGTYIVPVYPLSIGVDYTLWIDNLTFKYKPAPVTTTAATDVQASHFTANWNAIGNATSYKVILYTGVVDPITSTTTWTAQTASNATVTTTTHTFTGLTANTLYGYRVTATDGDVTTGYNSVYQSVTTALVDAINEVNSDNKVFVSQGKVVVRTSANQSIEIYNSLGQKVASAISIDGDNEFAVQSKGVHIVKLGKATEKVVL